MPRPIRNIIEDQEVFSCPSDTSVSEAALLMKQHQIGAMMVVDDGKLVGVFTERDALFRVVAEGRDTQTTRVSEVMTANPQIIDPDKPFAHALQMMHHTLQGKTSQGVQSLVDKRNPDQMHVGGEAAPCKPCHNGII